MLLFLAWIGMLALSIAVAVLSIGEPLRIGPFEIAYTGLPEPRAQRLLAFVDDLRLPNERKVDDGTSDSL